MTNETVNKKGADTRPNANWQATRTEAPRQGPLYEDDGRAPAGENLVDGGPDDGGATGVGSSVPQPSLQREQAGSGGLTGGATRDDAEGEEPPPRPVPEALFELFKANWMIVAAIAVVLFVVILAVKMIGGGASSDQSTAGEAANETPPPANGEQALESAPESAASTTDTGVAFEAPTEQGGDYYIKAGELAWKGKKEATDQGEKITVEGATAAQFTRAVALPGGSITTGVIGRAEPEGQTLHATYQRVDLGENQKTSGTYYTVAEGLITSRGDYEDERSGETVTRTYDETRYAQGSRPENVTYQVTFDAPPETPIPVLVGHVDPPTG